MSPLIVSKCRRRGDVDHSSPAAADAASYRSALRAPRAASATHAARRSSRAARDGDRPQVEPVVEGAAKMASVAATMAAMIDDASRGPARSLDHLHGDAALARLAHSVPGSGGAIEPERDTSLGSGRASPGCAGSPRFVEPRQSAGYSFTASPSRRRRYPRSCLLLERRRAGRACRAGARRADAVFSWSVQSREPRGDLHC